MYKSCIFLGVKRDLRHCSMKQLHLGGSLLPLDTMILPCRFSPPQISSGFPDSLPVSIYTPAWAERGTVRVKSAVPPTNYI